MSRTVSRHVARKQERKLDQILRVAGDVFVQKGYFAATTRDIAEQVNIQAGSLYYYIESKEAALIEICRRTGRQFTANLEALLARDEPADVLIREGIVQHMRNNRAHLVSHFAFSPRELPPAVRRELKRMSRDYQCLWEELLRRGVRDGRLKSGVNPATAAVALLAMCNGSVEWYQRKAPDRVIQIAQEFADCFLRGIAAAQRAAR
jgi:AcrR family transcriptional regulator